MSVYKGLDICSICNIGNKIYEHNRTKMKYLCCGICDFKICEECEANNKNKYITYCIDYFYCNTLICYKCMKYGK